MDIIIFEDDIKYDGWIKPVLVFPILLLIGLGIAFLADARYSDIFPKEPAAESYPAAMVLFASAIFVLAVYGLVMPRKIYVTQGGIRIKFGAFSWMIPYRTIETIKPESGWLVFWAHTFITSYRNQIEIVRKNRMRIRICPLRRDEFVQCASRALEDSRRGK